MISVGIIDTIGFVGAVNALDTCLKTADVQFVRFEKMSGGIVSIIIKGDVGAVSASIMAGIEAAAAVGELRNHTIIARLDDQSEMMLNKAVAQRSEVSGGGVDSNRDAGVVIIELENQAQCEQPLEPMLAPIDQKAVINSVPETQEETKTVTLSYSEEDLNLMTVSQLRRLARELNIKGISREKIKRSRKVDLVVNILVELNESTVRKEEEE